MAPPTRLHLQFPRETGLILMCAGKIGNPFHTKQEKRHSCCNQEGEGAQMMWCGEHGCYPRVRPVCWGTLGVPSWVPSTVLHFSRNVGLLLRRCGGQGPHAAKTMDPRGFSRVAEGFSSYDVDFRLPLVLALGSPNFPSSCEGKLDVVLESLQGQRDLI